MPGLGLRLSRTKVTERMTSRHDVRFPASPVQGLTLLILFKGTRRHRRRSDVSGRASQDLVLPWTQAPGSNDRSHAAAARNHSAWLELHSSNGARRHPTPLDGATVHEAGALQRLQQALQNSRNRSPTNAIDRRRRRGWKTGDEKLPPTLR